MRVAVGVPRLRRFARGLSRALGLPRTATAIVVLLGRSSRYLTVSEIVQRLQLSERSVRGNIALLVRRGVLERRAFVTAKNRLAYLYRLRPTDALLQTVRAQFAQNLEALRRAANRQPNPKTDASGRS